MELVLPQLVLKCSFGEQKPLRVPLTVLRRHEQRTTRTSNPQRGHP